MTSLIETDPAANGHHDEFPVDSLKEAAAHLRRPFTAQAVKFKVQATWPKEAPTSGLIVPYIDARLVIDRLNLVCPHLWHEPDYIQQDKLLWCLLTVDGNTRRDVGEGYVGKGLVSDAFKRAGVKFGIGVSLYATPKIVLEKGRFLKDARTNKGPTLKLTEAGERRCREVYQAWLEESGISKFGQPLEHGDVEGAIGDPVDHEPEPDRRTATQRSAPAEDSDESVRAELALLLEEKVPVQQKRRELNEALMALGLSPRKRLATFKEATTNQQLIADINRANAVREANEVAARAAEGARKASGVDLFSQAGS